MFNFGKKYFLGVDFGTSAIKIVELSYKSGQIYLENYGWVETGFSSNGEKEPNELVSSFDQKLKYYLQELIRRMKLNTTSAHVSIPGYNGLINLVEFPELKKEELDQAVQFEARKHIPIPLDEIALSWEILGKSGNDPQSKKMQIMMVAAPRKELNRYEKMIDESGLKTSFVELETFSLVRSLIGDDLSRFILVDIGARTTNIILVEDGVVKVNRNIESGGYDVTGAIADSLKVSRSRAENLKKEKKDLLGGNELSLIVPSLEMVSSEILRIAKAFQDKNKDKKIDGIILSGGSAKIKGLDNYFFKIIGIKTVMGNPWRKILIRPELEAKVKEELGTSFSVAIGLALSGIEEYKRK